MIHFWKMKWNISVFIKCNKSKCFPHPFLIYLSSIWDSLSVSDNPRQTCSDPIKNGASWFVVYLGTVPKRESHLCQKVINEMLIIVHEQLKDRKRNKERYNYRKNISHYCNIACNYRKSPWNNFLSTVKMPNELDKSFSQR